MIIVIWERRPASQTSQENDFATRDCITKGTLSVCNKKQGYEHFVCAEDGEEYNGIMYWVIYCADEISQEHHADGIIRNEMFAVIFYTATDLLLELRLLLSYCLKHLLYRVNKIAKIVSTR